MGSNIHSGTNFMGRTYRCGLIVIFSLLFFLPLSLPAQDESQNAFPKEDSSYVELKSFDDLKSKYTDEDFIYEQSARQLGWWDRFKKWMSEGLKDLFNLGSVETALSITSYIIHGILISLFIVVLYLIFKAIANKEGKWLFGKSSDKKLVTATDVENNIHEVNFEELINEAEKNGNFRLAIRFYYLWLLKALNASEHIEYDLEKTNSDYYNEIKNPTIKNDFSYSSYLYNYIWYGEFNVGPAEFKVARNTFSNFLLKLKS